MTTTNDTLRNEIRPIATAVVETLGERWTLEEQDYSTGLTLVNDTGARLFMRINWRDESRVVISGEYPKQPMYTHSPVSHEITVARTKSGKAIAGDILRRLLPEYLTDLRSVQQRIAEREVREVREVEVAKSLEVVPETLRDFGDASRGLHRWELRGVGEFTVILRPEQETVVLKLTDLTPEEAQVVLLALQDNRRAQEFRANMED